jgi:hypothetical protein
VLYYDWKETLPIAIKQEWDMPPYGGSPHERAMRTMRYEYNDWRRWCADDWWYVYWSFTLYDPEKNEIGNDSCCGYPSYGMPYLWSHMRESAAHMVRDAHRKFFRERGDAWKQYALAIA